MNYCKFYAYTVREVASKTAWRVFVRLYLHLFPVNMRRWATLIEQATFNERQLGGNLIPLNAIVTPARRFVGETTLFFAPPENKMLPMDLWNCSALITYGVGDLSAALRAIESRSATAIIARGFPKACTIVTLIA